MSTYETATDRGFLLSGREWTAIGGGAALMALNVLVMFVVVATPLAALNRYLFSVPLVGVLVYGAAIYAGESLAETGVESGNVGVALGGVAVLQLAFGAFGAGVLSTAAPGSRLLVLGVTAVVVAVMTAAIGTYVYARSIDFDHYSTWSMYAFVGGLVAVLVGSFVTPALLVGFLLIFAGFVLRLGWEIWRIRDGRTRAVSLQAIGLYVAVAGVFVHVLQIVVRLVGRR